MGVQDVVGEGAGDVGVSPLPSARVNRGLVAVGRISGGADTLVSTGTMKGLGVTRPAPNIAGTRPLGCWNGVAAATVRLLWGAADVPMPPPRRLVTLPRSARASASRGVTLLPAPSARTGASGPASVGRAPPSAMAASETALAAAKANLRPRHGERSASLPTSWMGNAERDAAPGITAAEPCGVGR